MKIKFIVPDGTEFDSHEEALRYLIEEKKIPEEKAEGMIKEVFEASEAELEEDGFFPALEEKFDIEIKKEEPKENLEEILDESEEETEEVLDESLEEGIDIEVNEDLLKELKKSTMKQILKEHGKTIEDLTKEELESLVRVTLAREMLRISSSPFRERKASEVKQVPSDNN